jgi:hypothetical protein
MVATPGLLVVGRVASCAFMTFKEVPMRDMTATTENHDAGLDSGMPTLPQPETKRPTDSRAKPGE